MRRNVEGAACISGLSLCAEADCSCSVVEVIWWRRYWCSARPSLTLHLLFPFHCNSCWDWLLGDHILGTKRAQLVWTGLSVTTSCCGCESLLSIQAFRLENHLSCFSIYVFMCVNRRYSRPDCAHIVWEDKKRRRWFWLCFIAFFQMATFHAWFPFSLSLYCCVASKKNKNALPSCLCKREQNHPHFLFKCWCFSLQSGRVGPVKSGVTFHSLSKLG